MITIFLKTYTRWTRQSLSATNSWIQDKDFFPNLILGVKNHLNGKSTNVYSVYEMYTKWVFLKGGIYVKVVDSRQGGGGGRKEKSS